MFWTDATHGTVSRVPTTGGPSVTLATGQDQPTQPALFGGAVYWINRGGSGALMKVSTAGGAPNMVTETPDPGNVAVGRGINGFAIAPDGRIFYSSANVVWLLHVDGPERIVDVRPGWPAGLAYDGGMLAFTNGAADRISTTPIIPMIPTECGDGCLIAVTQQNLFYPIFAQNGRTYWVSDYDYTLYSGATALPFDRQDQTAVYQPSRELGGIQTFTLHGDHALAALGWGLIVDGPLVAHAVAVPIAQEHIAVNRGINSIVADDTHVFWTMFDIKDGTCWIDGVAR